MLWSGVLPEAGEGEAVGPQLNLHSAAIVVLNLKIDNERGWCIKPSSFFSSFFQDCMGIFAKQEPPASMRYSQLFVKITQQLRICSINDACCQFFVISIVFSSFPPFFQDCRQIHSEKRTCNISKEKRKERQSVH